jgi:HEAT repeat protein
VEGNRDSFINEGALPAMKWLADEPVVKARLLELAATKSKTPAGNQRRVGALAALEGKVFSNDLQGVLELALDSSSPADVRDAAFDRVGDIRSPAALPSLWPLVASNENARLRWRAGELVLAIGGPQIMPEFFSKLPSNGDYAQEELEGYATRMGQMAPPPTQLVREQLTAQAWYNRVIAIRFFERKGGPADVEQLKALTADKASTKGPRWGKTKTVGDVAEEALTAAKQRLAEPAAR